MQIASQSKSKRGCPRSTARKFCYVHTNQPSCDGKEYNVQHCQTEILQEEGYPADEKASAEALHFRASQGKELCMLSASCLICHVELSWSTSPVTQPSIESPSTLSQPRLAAGCWQVVWGFWSRRLGSGCAVWCQSDSEVSGCFIGNVLSDTCAMQLGIH